MGQAKKYLMDVESAEDVLSNLLRLLESVEIEKKITQYGIDIDRYKNFIQFLMDGSIYARNNINTRYIDFIFTYIEPIQYDIEELVMKNTPNQSINSLIGKFEIAMNEYKKTNLNNLDENRNNKVVNSEEYYNKKIEELKKRESELLNTLKETTGKSAQEITRAKTEIDNAKLKISEYEKALEIKQKQEDAEESWKYNIVNTFEELKTYLQPIKVEQTRLNVMFWVYLVLSTLLVIGVLIIEYVAVKKISLEVSYPDFKQYVTIYLPLPVAGALLWGFIYQMNRAQRQLVVVAKSIHKVEYIQGLLLSINKLAPSVENGIKRINTALDKLIDNHLIEKSVETEEEIIREEKKDVVPVDSLIKLLKEIKGVVGKD